jgi:hypothetical protein
MRDLRLIATCLLWGLQLGTENVARSQETALSGRELETYPEASRDESRPSQLEIEIIVFAYNAFDPTEEEFDGDGWSPKLGPDPAVGRSSNDQSFDHAGDAERGSNGPDLPQFANIQPETSRGPFRFSLLGPGDLRLTSARDRLERLGAYTVLIHGGWVQESLPEERAHSFDLSLFSAPSLTGNMALHVSRFLHVSASLDYHVPASSPERLPPKYQLRQTRRMRSGELHYFDHPAFGLLVTVRPHRQTRNAEHTQATPLKNSP